MQEMVTYIHVSQEQDKSSDIKQQPPIGDRKYRNALPQIGGGGQNQREHPI